MIRHWAGVAVVASIALLSACDVEGDPHIAIIYENNTDSRFCLWQSDPPVQCSAPIEPMSHKGYFGDCFTIDGGSAEVTLYEESTGDLIYTRTAGCREWINAGEMITIDKQGDEFVVTDGFPE